MPGRITQRFNDLAGQGKSGLVAFLTAGDPDADATLRYMQSVVRGGADIVELGVPFSDPMADGPIIQRAGERALAGGMNLRRVLDLVARFRAGDAVTPVVLMGYLNPIEHMGYENFARRAAEAGVDAVLTVDLPPEEAEGFHDVLLAHRLDHIFLLAPTSDRARIAAVSRYASGFVYYVSVKGVTGDKSLDAHEVRTRVAELKSTITLPVGVGFGVKTPATAAAIAHACDAVIVGSALVEIIERNAGGVNATEQALCSFVGDLRAAMDATRRPAHECGSVA